MFIAATTIMCVWFLPIITKTRAAENTLVIPLVLGVAGRIYMISAASGVSLSCSG